MQETQNSSIANIINPLGRSRYVLICEHASHYIPPQYNNLGLPKTAIQRHIGWDIGAQAVAVEMSKLLDAPLVLQTCSRLLYDCNRPPTDPSAITEMSESTPIPGNCHLSDAQKQARAEQIYYPFHQSISQLLDERQATATSLSLCIVLIQLTTVNQEP